MYYLKEISWSWDFLVFNQKKRELCLMDRSLYPEKNIHGLTYFWNKILACYPVESDVRNLAKVLKSELWIFLHIYKSVSNWNLSIHILVFFQKCPAFGTFKNLPFKTNDNLLEQKIISFNQICLKLQILISKIIKINYWGSKEMSRKYFASKKYLTIAKDQLSLP